jgi:hypothetical protein
MAKRLIAILVVLDLVGIFNGSDPAFARFHRDPPMGGFSLWQIFIGVFFLFVMFAAFSGGPNKKEREENNQKLKESIRKEKESKGLVKYYGEILLAMCYWPLGPFILVGIAWLYQSFFK